MKKIEIGVKLLQKKKKIFHRIKQKNKICETKKKKKSVIESEAKGLTGTQTPIPEA